MAEKLIKKYCSDAVANFFIEKAMEEGVQLSPMKLQKLVYFALGWSLSFNKTDIIGGEPVQAWKYGPVIPSLYHSLKFYGNNPVTDVIPGLFGAYDEEGNQISEPEPSRIEPNDVRTINVLNSVWNAYKDFTATQLSDITHRHNTPWKMHFQDGGRNIEIPKETIQAFYDVLRKKA